MGNNNLNNVAQRTICSKLVCFRCGVTPRTIDTYLLNRAIIVYQSLLSKKTNVIFGIPIRMLERRAFRHQNILYNVFFFFYLRIFNMSNCIQEPTFLLSMVSPSPTTSTVNRGNKSIHALIVIVLVVSLKHLIMLFSEFQKILPSISFDFSFEHTYIHLHNPGASSGPHTAFVVETPAASAVL